MAKRKSLYPMFDEYPLDVLESRIKYKPLYLLAISSGRKPANKRFRANACGILNRTEAELFGSVLNDAD